jgi:hypothetical protein
MEPTQDVDDLWDGLNLGGLLNDLARENESALAQAKKMQARKVSILYVFSSLWLVLVFLLDAHHSCAVFASLLPRRFLGNISCLSSFVFLCSLLILLSPTQLLTRLFIYLSFIRTGSLQETQQDAQEPCLQCSYG